MEVTCSPTHHMKDCVGTASKLESSKHKTRPTDDTPS